MWRRTRRLDRTVARYVAILLTVLLVILGGTHMLSLQDDAMRAADTIRLDVRRSLQLQVDEETGVRGFTLTGSRLFLDPYDRAQKPLDELITSLEARVQDDRASAAAISHFDFLHDAWKRNVAEPILAHPHGTAGNVRRERVGKGLIDAMRRDMAYIDDAYARRYDALAARKLVMRYLMSLVVLLAVAFVAASGYYAERQSIRREEELLRTSLEARDAEARRSEWRSKIIAMLAHDFRSSLGVIRAYAEMLQAFPEKRGDLSAYDVIVKSVGDLTAMTEEALLMARLSNNALNVRLRAQPVFDIVAEAAERHEAERTIRITPSEEEVMADRPYLVRLFDNLISNAVKYSPAPAPIDIDISRKDGDVEVAVTDYGAGIDPADLPHVFEEYWRAQSASMRSGSGIGLFIVKNIAEAHNGSAAIESHPGEGTTVRIRIPSAVASLTVLS